MQKTIHTEPARCLCELLREARIAAGLRQVDLAERLGTLQATVSNFETGQRRLDLTELAQVCAALNLDLVEFVARFRDRCLNVEHSDAG